MPFCVKKFCSVESEFVAQIACNKNLIKFEISEPNFHPEDLKSFLTHSPNLKSLRMPYLTDFNLQTLAESCKMIQRLHIGTSTVTDWSPLLKLPELRSMYKKTMISSNFLARWQVHHQETLKNVRVFWICLLNDFLHLVQFLPIGNLLL